MSKQNVVNLSLSEAQLDAVNAALTTLETHLKGLVSLTAVDKRRLRKMGSKNESFSRQALQVISQSPQMIPPNIPVDEAIASLRLLDQLRPLQTRLTRLCERSSDTDAALGSEIMGVALKAYGLMKMSGGADGVEGLRRDLSVRFSNKRRARPAEGAAPAASREAA